MRGQLTSSIVLRQIEEERERQVREEGFGPAHDDLHVAGELAAAAAAYAMRAGVWFANGGGLLTKLTGTARKYTNIMAPDFWPWDPKWWKPRNPRRDLVRAAALIVAEIERIDRLAQGEQP